MNESPVGTNAVDQIMRIFVLPELQRRMDAGTIPTEMIAEQPDGDKPGMLLSPSVTLVLLEDERPARVLIDGEVPIEVLAKSPRAMGLGDTTRINDVEVLDFRFTELPPNA